MSSTVEPAPGVARQHLSVVQVAALTQNPAVRLTALHHPDQYELVLDEWQEIRPEPTVAPDPDPTRSA